MMTTIIVYVGKAEREGERQRQIGTDQGWRVKEREEGLEVH
jgi:hypothetical protein